MTRRIVVASVALAAAVMLTGCVAQPEPPAPAPTQASPRPSASPQPSSSPLSPAEEGEPAEPGSAEEAKSRFDAALQTLIAATPDPNGRAVIDALAGAGFDKTSMEVTPDATAIGLDADSIQFSVRVGEECVVGQSGNVGYHSAVLPVLATGTCLVGKTRTIDW